MQTQDSLVDMMIEDIVESMLEVEGTTDSDQAKQALEGFRAFTQRLSHGMRLLIANPGFTRFFSSGIADAKNDEGFLQIRLGLTDQQMADMYEYGVSCYREAKYSDSSDILMCLCMLNPFVAGFWRALGLSQEAEKDYRSAIMSYAVALERDDNLGPAIFTARCLMHLGHRAEAIEVLDQAVALAQEGGVPEYFHKQVKELRALLV